MRFATQSHGSGASDTQLDRSEHDVRLPNCDVYADHACNVVERALLSGGALLPPAIAAIDHDVHSNASGGSVSVMIYAGSPERGN
jgi:hypothetical protein